MKHLSEGKEKIDQIASLLRLETLEPAEREAAKIIAEAKRQAEEIVKESEAKAKERVAQAKASIERERQVYERSLLQSAKLALEALRQGIERELFSGELHLAVIAESAKPGLISKLIESMVLAIDKAGMGADLSALIPKEVKPEEVTALLSARILDRLRGGKVVLGDFAGGVALKLHEERITIDLSDEALFELLATHARKDFRKLFFGEKAV